ncbi:MAG: hypothetical protein KDA25_11170 [Phycisphaerales bacterium]|nr:hypothetical protein [Phycisphaerales bacterium]
MTPCTIVLVTMGALAGGVDDPTGSTLCSGAAEGPCFAGLGDLPGGGQGSQALGIAASGSAVVGQSQSQTSGEAFRWTVAGMEGLGFVANGSNSRAIASSADGNIIVGAGTDQLGFVQAFRWTSHDGMQALPTLDGGAESSAVAVNGGGTIAVGWSTYIDGSTEAQVWREKETTGLGDLPGGLMTSRAAALSDDGSVVVGWGNSGVTEAFRWTEDEGMVGIGFLPGAILNGSQAFGVSQDGTHVVGMSWSPTGIEAFHWSAAGGMAGLGDLPGGSALDFSFAFDVSADGRVIVGLGQDDDGGAAVIWMDGVIHRLQDVLEDEYGLVLPGWHLAEAKAVSADGRTIVGIGYHDDLPEGWIVRLPGPCTIDLDGDGLIDTTDLNIVLANWGESGGIADLNASGLVDAADLTIILANWGECP